MVEANKLRNLLLWDANTTNLNRESGESSKNSNNQNTFNNVTNGYNRTTPNSSQQKLSDKLRNVFNKEKENASRFQWVVNKWVDVFRNATWIQPDNTNYEKRDLTSPVSVWRFSFTPTETRDIVPEATGASQWGFNTTPGMVRPWEWWNPLKATIWAARATTDYLAWEAALFSNDFAWEERIDPKYIREATKEMIANDVKTYGQYSINRAWDDWLKYRKIGKYGWNKAWLTDVVALGSIAFFDLFWDPALAIGELKAVWELAKWRRAWRVSWAMVDETRLGKNISSWKFEIRLDPNTKLKVSQNWDWIVVEWYTKRWW